jgi:hypothetical protein
VNHVFSFIIVLRKYVVKEPGIMGRRSYETQKSERSRIILHGIYWDSIDRSMIKGNNNISGSL